MPLILYLIAGFVSMLGIVLSLGFWWISATAWGKWVALGGLALSLLPLAFSLRHTRPEGRRFWSAASLGLTLVFLGVTAGVFITTPSGSPAPGSPVSQRFTRNTQFPRYTIANMVPETEQINLGFWTVPFVDRLFTRQRAQRTMGFTLDLYRQMESDPNFRALGSSMGWAYADVLGQPFDSGHYYLYVPQKPAAGPRPALVFLHGSFGNFKAYTYVLARFAEENNFVIIAPSFGFGNWRAQGGTEAARRALEDAQSVVKIDPQQVYLAGLSNGGLGISLLANENPDVFRGLIFISPVMVTEIIDSPEFLAAWRGRPVLVVTGEDDERIPFAYVNERVQRLEVGGVDVSYYTYPGEDHFLFFSQPESILKEFSSWVYHKQ